MTTPSSTITQAQLDSLRERYVARLKGRVQELEASLRLLIAGGWLPEHLDALHSQAHSLAGSAATFGLHTVGAAAQELEVFLAQLPADPALAHVDVQAQLEALVATIAGATRTSQEEASATLAPRAAAPRGRSEGQTTVLLVEDDPATAHHLAIQLEHFGYRAVVLHRLEDIEGAIAAHTPAAIIMDIVFPEGDLAGPQRMASVQPGDDVPVIFVSGRSDFEARLWAVRASGKAYLTKPTDIDTLVSTLDTLTGAFVPEPYRILIVDDTRMMSALYEATLRDAGMLTVALNDPAGIIQALQEFQPDLLLLDMYMPNCTGTEVATLIRQQPAFISLPIVFLSGERDREHQLAALDQGGDDFLTKPIAGAQLVSAVTSRARRARAMRAQLSRDGLTGLLTHASIKEQAMREIVRAQRYATDLSIAMIDLDHFKQINDRYGHAAGDRVLKGLARLLHQRLRMSDSIGRYGGEEFLIILPQTSGSAAMGVLDDIRARFGMIGHQLGDGETAVTFSGGIASLDASDDGIHLLEAADAALYAAKRAGRNRIVLAARGDARPPAPYPAASALADAPELRGLRALVLEAEPPGAGALADRLRQHGVLCQRAATLATAHQELAHAPPELIFIDLAVAQAGEILSMARAAAADAAIVVLADHAGEHAALSALRQGADDLMRKPVAAADLPVALARAQALLRLRRQLAALQRHGEDG